MISVAAACTTGTHRQPPAPEPTALPPAAQPSASTPNPVAGLWLFRYLPQTLSYHVIRNAVIESAADSNPQRNVVTNITRESLVLSPVAGDSTAVGLTAKVDTFSTVTQGRIGGMAAVSTPIQLNATLTTEGLVFDVANSPGSCTDAGISILATDLQNLMPRLPSSISSGQHWQDSVTTQGCQGGVPTVSSAARWFVTAGELSYKGQQTIVIQRTDSISAHGEGMQQQHQISTTAVGTGHATFYVDVALGRVVHLDVTQVIRLTISTVNRQMPFVQTLQESFDLIP